MKRKDIRSYSKEQLESIFIEEGLPAFRGRQVYEWLWKKGVQSFEEMTSLSKHLREYLNQYFIINHILVDRMQRSDDGTIKSAIRLHDGLMVESVLIPVEKRTTACVSSQVGCSLDCAFCATATLKRQRNLTPDEIYDQIKILNKQSELYYGIRLKNIVFMGMGEPLMNYTNVMTAIDRITSKEGFNFSPSRITISTSGIPKMIKKMADDNPKFKLAVSLHSAIEPLRNTIMPFSKSFPLEQLKKALIYWYAKTKSKVTYEYIVWRGLNDTEKDIISLINFCKTIPCKVNLIEYNPIGNPHFLKSSQKTIENYIQALEASQFIVKVRHSRGRDIDAACGQLVNKTKEEV